jgi:hypothetical protein
MRSAVVWLLLLYIVVVVDCATAGWPPSWPVQKDFWRLCLLLGTSCMTSVFTGFGRRGAIGLLNGHVALAVAIGFLVRGVINLVAALTH